ncbi:jg2935 [Pararge aegeria aegeria]|uniref:Jg2935 protein n=1 Tax=Pararge aegeria aegeria TaxID=348720 RepID=A0A8S4SLQ6_9NEOP|nr:jg2935 [Pararge aegeria aegeria]
MNSQPNVGNVKCHKCRQVLLSDLSATYNKSRCKDTCSSYNRNNFIYLLEDHLPAWIKVKIEEEQWTKGKLHCENCGCKVGTFDFVSGRKYAHLPSGNNQPVSRFCNVLQTNLAWCPLHWHVKYKQNSSIE